MSFVSGQGSGNRPYTGGTGARRGGRGGFHGGSRATPGDANTILHDLISEMLLSQRDALHYLQAEQQKQNSGKQVGATSASAKTAGTAEADEQAEQQQQHQREAAWARLPEQYRPLMRRLYISQQAYRGASSADEQVTYSLRLDPPKQDWDIAAYRMPSADKAGLMAILPPVPASSPWWEAERDIAAKLEAMRERVIAENHLLAPAAASASSSSSSSSSSTATSSPLALSKSDTTFEVRLGATCLDGERHDYRYRGNGSVAIFGTGNKLKQLCARVNALIEKQITKDQTDSEVISVAALPVAKLAHLVPMCAELSAIKEKQWGLRKAHKYPSSSGGGSSGGTGVEFGAGADSKRTEELTAKVSTAIRAMIIDSHNGAPPSVSTAASSSSSSSSSLASSAAPKAAEAVRGIPPESCKCHFAYHVRELLDSSASPVVHEWAPVVLAAAGQAPATDAATSAGGGSAAASIGTWSARGRSSSSSSLADVLEHVPDLHVVVVVYAQGEVDLPGGRRTLGCNSFGGAVIRALAEARIALPRVPAGDPCFVVSAPASGDSVLSSSAAASYRAAYQKLQDDHEKKTTTASRAAAGQSRLSPYWYGPWVDDNLEEFQRNVTKSKESIVDLTEDPEMQLLADAWDKPHTGGHKTVFVYAYGSLVPTSSASASAASTGGSRRGDQGTEGADDVANLLGGMKIASSPSPSSASSP